MDNIQRPLPQPKDSVTMYVSEIEHLRWHHVDLITWKLMQEAGVEHRSHKRHIWKVASLPISERDVSGLRAHDQTTTRKFDRLRRALLKRNEHVLVDHGNGVVRIVKQ